MKSVGAVAGGARRVDTVLRLRLGFFALALAVALVLVLVVWQRQSAVARSGDVYMFGDLGRNLANGSGFRFTGRPLTVRRAPLYPAAIAALFLIFGEHPLAIQLFQCALVAGTCLLVFEIARRLFSIRTAVIAAAISIVHPMVMRYVPDIQVETLLTFLYTLTAYRTIRLLESGTVVNGFGVGVSAALAAMVKGVALPYPAFFIAYYLFSRRRSSGTRGLRLPGWQPIAAMLVAMALVILPWTYRNYRLTHQFVLISGNASAEFLRGYVFAQPRYYLLQAHAYEAGENEANAMQERIYDDNGLSWSRDEQGLIWVGDEAAAERVQNVVAKAKLRADPVGFVKKVFIGLFMFWYVVTNRFNSLVLAGLAAAAWILAGIGIVRRRRDEPQRFVVLLLPIATLNLFYAAVLALGRYSAPCVPCLIVLASVGIESLLSRTRRREPGRLAMPAPAAGA